MESLANLIQSLTPPQGQGIPIPNTQTGLNWPNDNRNHFGNPNSDGAIRQAMRMKLLNGKAAQDQAISLAQPGAGESALMGINQFFNQIMHRDRRIDQAIKDQSK